MADDSGGRGSYRFNRSSNRDNGNGKGFRDGNRSGGDVLGAFVPPQNIEAEQSTLGAMLLQRAAIEKAAEILEKDDFYRDAHQTLFEAITALAQRDEPVDLITVQEELRNHDKLEAIGGLTYLTALFDSVPTAANVEYYAKIVQEKAILRRLIEAAFEILGIARGEVEDIDELIDQAERAVFSVSQQRTSQYFSSLSFLLNGVYGRAEEMQDHQEKISGLSTGINDFDMITSGLQNTDLIIVAARPSMGKCLTAGSLIDDPATGERLTIAECVRRQTPAVLSLSETGSVRPAKVAAWVDSGVKPCFRVRTCTGRSVEVTGHHPFLTVNGWTPLHDISVGSKIAVPRRVPAFGTEEQTPLELVRLTAYFIAEGGLTAKTPAFTNIDPVILQDFRDIIEQHYPSCVVRRRGITDFVVRPTRSEWKSSLNPVTDWLRTLGLWGKMADEKSFPECVWRWPKTHLAEFLRVLMSCDGTLYSMQDYPRIEFAVASQKLAEDLHHALTRFGIVAKFWRKSPQCWRVEITEPQSVATYQSEIGWIGEKANRFPNSSSVMRRSNTGHAPTDVWTLIKQALAAQQMSMVELARQAGETTRIGKYAGYNPHMNRIIPMRRLARYAEVLDNDILRRLAGPDIYWDEIIAIESIGEHQVYDLSVPEGSNFIAQDICVHNTSLCLSVAEHVALRENKPVAIFSLEMSAPQLAMRMICSQGMINSHKLRTGRMSEEEWGKLANVVQGMYEAPIFIDDATETTALTMRSKCRRLMAEHGLGLVVVDYLQLMRSHRRTENRVQEIGEIARGLKSLARELKVPVIALSQLSRAVETRENKRPMLSDLRESGSIEAEADMVCFLYREAYYKMKEAYQLEGGERPERQEVEETEIIIGKHRNGPTGMIKVGFMPDFAKFVDLEMNRPDEPTGM
jgi:replicative DNA helicase